MRLRLASYNIHGGIGRDGHIDFARTSAVLEELNCDVIALQEVAASGGTKGSLLGQLAVNTHRTGIAGPTLMRECGPYGNALLTRLPVLDVQRIDLSVTGREPRGAVVVGLACAGQSIQVAATHLGLRPAERRIQIRRLLGKLSHDDEGLSVLMGDINEWFLWGRPLRWLHAQYGRPPSSPATFPARFPLLALDRIWVHPLYALRKMWVHDSPLARTASDHLPILAALDWTAA